MLTELTSLITKINSSIITYYENDAMANVVADSHDYDKYYCLINEFQEGVLNKLNNGQKLNKPKVRLYFYKCSELENNATDRETIREYLQTNAVKILFDELCKSSLFNGQLNWFYPPCSRFDCNDCGVLVEFEYTSRIC